MHYTYCMCFILYFDGCETLVALQVFLILMPTGTSPTHTRTHTHTPGPEDAVVSDGNSRGRSAGLSVSRGARWAILPFPSAQAAFHLCLIPQRATYPPFTGSPSLSSWTAASRDHSLIKSWLLIFTAKQQKVRLLVWMPSALMLVCAEVTYILYSSLKVF